MEQSQTIEQIKHVLAEVCEVDQSSIQPGGKLLGYGVDSVGMVDLILSLEAVFDIAIDEADPTLASVETVRDLADYVTSRQ
ncbi:MAG: acyl carrier protein [Gemmatimonadetes bacterium]|nr:acyl carrier protein [Gemmatimonadota bacterium]